jgi:hypothetical protein
VALNYTHVLHIVVHLFLIVVNKKRGNIVVKH